MIVANPIYDIVFKYLMEDERIAKTILSALLKMDVVDVKVRRNENAGMTPELIAAHLGVPIETVTRHLD